MSSPCILKKEVRKYMRCYNREKMIYHGNYLDVQIYPVFTDRRPKGARRRKAKPTSEVQQKLNERNAVNRIIWLINNNFTTKDYALHLSYNDRYLPHSFEESEWEQKKFLRRLRYALKKIGIELKYYAATEESTIEHRFHHHLIVSGNLPINEIAEMWGNGYIQVKPLQFDEKGVANLAAYISREKGARKSVTHSRNLKKPAERQRDGKVSHKTLREIHNHDCDIRAFCKKQYPGYELAELKPYYNDMNGFIYTIIRLYKPEIFKKRGKRSICT